MLSLICSLTINLRIDAKYSRPIAKPAASKTASVTIITPTGKPPVSYKLLRRYELDIVMTYNLLFNVSLLVEEGLGYAICYDRIINTSGDSKLCFRPLYPAIEIEMYMIRKKYQVFSKPAEKFLLMMQENINTVLK